MALAKSDEEAGVASLSNKEEFSLVISFIIILPILLVFITVTNYYYKIVISTVVNTGLNSFALAIVYTDHLRGDFKSC